MTFTKSKTKTSISLIALTMAMSGATNTAFAQTSGDNAFALDEIIVTARRTAESINDAPLAIGVLDENFIKKQRVEDVRELLTLVPGATFVSFSKAQPEKALRGFVAPTPGNSSSEQSILTVVDNVVLAKDFLKSPPIYDVQNIEVLRGPQGTTFGRNASVGLIHVQTKKPTFETEKGFSVSVGSDELIEVDGYYSGAITENIAGRLAFNYDDNDGPTEDTLTGEGLNGESNFSVRGSLLYEPSDQTSAYLKVEHSIDNDEAPVRRGRDCTVPFIDGPRATDFDFTGIAHPAFDSTFFDSCDVFETQISSGQEFFLDRDITTVSGEISHQFANDLTLTSVTGFQTGENDALADVLGSPDNIVFQQVQNDGWFFSEEIRLDNHASGDPLRWLAGLYYLTDQEDRFEQNQFFPEGSTTLGIPGTRVTSGLATISDNETDSIAVFGELLYDVTDKIEVAVGGRYTNDDKDYEYSVEAFGFSPVLRGVDGCPAAGIGLCVVPGTTTVATEDNPAGFAPIEVSDSWNAFTGKASISYDLSDTKTLYALWSQGFKSGGFQSDARSAAEAIIPFDEEDSQNFEIGLKGQEQTIRYTLTAFYMENDGTQTVSLIPVGDSFSGLITNLGSVETLGIEADFTWAPTDYLVFGGSGGLFDSELADTILNEGVSGEADPLDNERDISGIRPEAAPRWTFTLNMEHTTNFSNGSYLSLRGDVIGRDDVWDDIIARETEDRLRPEIINFGARATYGFGPNNEYRLMAWGKNLNEDYDIDNIGPSQPNTLQLPVGFTNKRAYGVTFSADW